jgi:hypothetical protein
MSGIISHNESGHRVDRHIAGPAFIALCTLPLHALGDGLSPAAEMVLKNVSSIEFLGQAIFAIGFQFAGTEVGGLSAIAYDPDSVTMRQICAPYRKA